MSFRFRTFRRMLLGLISILASISVILSIYLRHLFTSGKVFWLVICVQSICIFRSLWSALSKPLLKRPQSVAAETIGLSVLLPFELILALVLLAAMSIPIGNAAYLVLPILVLTSAVIDLGYIIALLITTTITAAAYDQDVWIRDIDSSPSPFPIPILVSFVLGRQSSSSSTPAERLHPLCLPGCNCAVKLHPSMTMASGIPSPALTVERPRSESLRGELVRIPNAADRRASIVIAFEVGH